MGVIVVMYRSSDVIADCLTSLLKSRPWLGRIVLVDNASPDESVEIAVGVAVAVAVGGGALVAITYAIAVGIKGNYR